MVIIRAINDREGLLTDNLIKLDWALLGEVDKLDEAGVLAEEFDLLGIHILATRNAPNSFKNLANILTGPFLIDVL
jgi:hypothetical protein